MSPIQGSKLLIFMMVALAHYPVFCRTFGAYFEHPTYMEGLRGGFFLFFVFIYNS